MQSQCIPNSDRRMKQSKQNQNKQPHRRCVEGGETNWKHVYVCAHASMSAFALCCVAFAFVGSSLRWFVGCRCLREHFSSSVCCGITTESRGNSVFRSVFALNPYVRVPIVCTSIVYSSKNGDKLVSVNDEMEN